MTFLLPSSICAFPLTGDRLMRAIHWAFCSQFGDRFQHFGHRTFVILLVYLPSKPPSKWEFGANRKWNYNSSVQANCQEQHCFWYSSLIFADCGINLEDYALFFTSLCANVCISNSGLLFQLLAPAVRNKVDDRDAIFSYMWPPEWNILYGLQLRTANLFLVSRSLSPLCLT